MKTLNKIIENNVKHLLCLILFALGIFFVLLAPNSTFAYSSSEIIPDYVFRSKGTMTEPEIQAFLVSKGSTLATYTIPPSQSKSYYIGGNLVTSYLNSWIGPVGGEVDATGWPVSRIISQASQWYNVNPQVLISILQKESSMITDPTNRTAPDKFARMAWIMGYAYTESGITNVCDTATNHNPSGSCAGVAMQIDWAAGALDTWYRRSEAGTLTCASLWNSALQKYVAQPCSAGQIVKIDGYSVYIGNHITGPFYRYTPHLSWAGTFTWCMQNWFPYDFKFNFDVTQSLYLSNCNPHEGESVTGSFSVKNISTNTFTINLTISDYAIDARGWNSFPYQTVTLAPNQTATYSATRAAKYTGRHFMQLAMGYNGGAYGLVSSTNKLTQFNYVTKSLPSDLTVTKGLWLSSVNPLVGDSVNGYYQVKNNTSNSLTVDLALVDYAVDAKTWNSYSLKTVTIPANSTAEFTGTHTIAGSGLHHTWLAFIYNGTAYNFTSSGQLMDFWYRTRAIDSSAFTVTKGLWLSSVNPLVGDSVNGYYQVKNNTSNSLTVDLALVDYAVDAKTWNSYSLKTVTIPANSTAEFTGTHTIAGSGLHHTWLAFIYNGTAYNFTSSGQLMDFWYRTR